MIADFFNLNGPYSNPAGCVLESQPGSRLAQFHPFLTSATAEMSRTQASTATLTFAAPVDEIGFWNIQDSDEISIREPIRILAQFSPFETVPVFEGYLTRLSASFPENRGTAQVTASCSDNTILLDGTHHRNTSHDEPVMDDVNFVSRVALAKGLLPDSDNENGPIRFTQAQNSTDAAFLFERACQNGFEFYARGRTLYFGPMRLDAEPQPTIKVYAGRQTNCIRFDVDHDGYKADRISVNTAAAIGDGVETRQVESNLEVLGTRPALNRNAPMGENHWFMTRSLTPDIEQAEAAAQVLVNEDAMCVRANGELDGALYRHVLVAGQPVGVSGAGETYDGRFYVDSVEHNFSDQGYRQKFQLMRNGLGDDLSAFSPRISPAL